MTRQGPEAQLKAAVVKALTLALGKRGRVLRLNAGNILVGPPGNQRMIAGVEAGTPDILVLLQSGRVCWLELKSARGKVTPTQARWHERARALGHTVAVIRETREALEVVRDVLQGRAAG